MNETRYVNRQVTFSIQEVRKNKAALIRYHRARLRETREAINSLREEPVIETTVTMAVPVMQGHPDYPNASPVMDPCDYVGSWKWVNVPPIRC